MTKKIIFLIFLALALTSCGAKKEELQVKKIYKTAQVSTGIVNISDNFIGYTKGIDQAMLATKAPGRITYLKKKIGDKVYAGELIASLDGAEAKSGYNTANKIVSNLVRIREKTSKALDEQIKAMEAKKKSVEAQISGVDTGLEDTKEITQKQIETAKTNLEQTKKELETTKQNILTGAKSSLTHTSIISTNTMDFVENLLGMDKSNDDFNDKIDSYLGKKDITHLNNTEKLYKEIEKTYKEYKDFYEKNIQNKENIDEKILIIGLEKAKNLINKEKELLNEVYKVISNSIENVYMPMEMINNLKKQVTELGVNLEKTLLSTSGDMLLGVSGSLENLKTFESKKQKAISLLEKQVSQYEAMAKGQVNGVETKKKVANLGLLEINAGIEALKAKKQATLSEINTKIAEAIGKKDQALVMINNGNIISPFSGIITNKMTEKGQVTNAGMPIYEIADNSKILLKVGVPASIISKLHTGDKLDVTIESKNKTFTGRVSNIGASANPITKKYEVEITLDNKKGLIPVGAMAIVSFNTDFKSPQLSSPSKGEEPIRIPNKAIVENYMLPGVYILDHNQAKFKKIKILKMGEYFSEVEGLKAGDKIITDGKENIYDGEILK